MSSAHVGSSARWQKLVICSSAPRLSHASALAGMTGLAGRFLARERDLLGDLRELARERLARGRGAVEDDAMVAARDARGHDRHRRAGIDAQVAGLAVDRVHGVRVGRVRKDRVVRPAELLDRRAVTRRELARLALDGGEVQPAAEPLVRPVAAAALDREAEQAGALLRHDVKREDHAGRAGVRLDGDPVGLPDGAHGRKYPGAAGGTYAARTRDGTPLRPARQSAARTRAPGDRAARPTPATARARRTSPRTRTTPRRRSAGSPARSSDRRARG